MTESVTMSVDTTPQFVSRGIQVVITPEVVSRGTQVPSEVTEFVSRGTQVTPELVPSPAAVGSVDDNFNLVESTVEKVDNVAEKLGISLDYRLMIPDFVHSCGVSLQYSGDPPPRVHNSTTSWKRHYSVLSFLLNGHLYADYEKLSGMLGLPSCSHTTWHLIVERLGAHVTKWSCSHVRDAIKTRGEHKKWIASFDGFYLTRGHYSNNSSATLHDYGTGAIAWFCHRTKRGPGHNWEGTSGGAEGDMFDELMGEAKAAGFVVSEIITDKDSSMNAIYCKHFPEGTITYCANHCAKTLHKDLQKIKQNKCQVRYKLCIFIFYFLAYQFTSF